MPTEARVRRVRKVLSLRQPDLRVVLEDLTNAHNASAVLRTCDAAGVLHVHFVSASGSPFPINTSISTRADKWVELHQHASMAECLSALKRRKFQIAATCVAGEAVPFTELDYTRPTAIIFGNESEGISREALELADHRITIPMRGMVQSLNLSVSVGVVLYEALRQRQAAGLSQGRRLSARDRAALTKKWLLPGGNER